MDRREKVILVVGSCGLDRLLTVAKYPRADAKVLGTAYHEVGGGNAANTASAMALLSSASIFSQNQQFRIKLITKVGADAIGQQLKEELDKSGVDTTYMLMGETGSTTSFTTVIVSEQEQTRTCIHTPGTGGNVTPDDIDNLDELFHNVVHVHSDSRLAEASLFLAQEAHKRNIPVSVDAEKDRKVEALDQLLARCDLLFTNEMQIKDHLERWTRNLEALYDRKPLSKPNIAVVGKEDMPTMEACALGIAPSHFFTRWFRADPIRNKEVVITKGHMGALHVGCDSSESRNPNDPDERHNVTIGRNSPSDRYATVHHFHTVFTKDGTEGWTEEYTYKVHHAGVLSQVDVVDTTGAGDAFIGAYILTQLMSPSPTDSIRFGLEFGAWVGGKKLGGPGARSALPSGTDVDNELGRTLQDVEGRLQTIIKPFGAL